jgi:ATP-dependent RNA helicase DDX19/DBP5
VCFAVALLQIVDQQQDYTQAVCLAPSMELAMQIYDVINELKKHTQITTALIVNRPSMGKPIDAHIIIGTPGFIEHGFKTKVLDKRGVRLLALDEADNVLKEGNSNTAACKIRLLLHAEDCRALLFSATFDDGSDDKIKTFRDKMFGQNEFEKILVPAEKLTVEKMQQYAVRCDNEDDKNALIVDICQNVLAKDANKQMIVFVNKREQVAPLKEKLERQVTTTTEWLSSDLATVARMRLYQRFRSGEIKVLISTNIIARGLDVANVAHVINYDIPMIDKFTPDYATYLHRTGRTARFGKRGHAINLYCDLSDLASVEMFRKYFKATISDVNKRDIVVHVTE